VQQLDRKAVVKLAEEYENHCFGILIDVTDNAWPMHQEILMNIL
jgi:hypothetical protein